MRLYEELLADGITYQLLYNMPIGIKTTIGRFRITCHNNFSGGAIYIIAKFIDNTIFAIDFRTDEDGFAYNCKHCNIKDATLNSLSHQLGMYKKDVIITIKNDTTEIIDTDCIIQINNKFVHHACNFASYRTFATNINRYFTCKY